VDPEDQGDHNPPWWTRSGFLHFADVYTPKKSYFTQLPKYGERSELATTASPDFR